MPKHCEPLRANRLGRPRPASRDSSATPLQGFEGRASELGEGLTAIEKEDATLARTLNSERLAETGLLVELDKLSREVPPEKFAEFTVRLKEAVKDRETLTDSLVELRTKFTEP